uniref:Salivary lipocalin n=1 Tax=Triatoma infestans TaxID=30076 RepID=A6YPF6_TRIIF|nr:salivary lipocalin [Triatoma infestans]
MKTILAVIFFGILAFAFADYPPIEKCNHPPAMTKLNQKKFLNGTWYVTKAKHGSDSTVCRQYKAKFNDKKQQFIGDGYYTFQNQTAYFTVRCTRQPRNNKNTKKRMQFICTQKNPDDERMQFRFQLEVTVLGTDYANYAVMYRCVQFPPELGSQFEDNTLLLHRNPEQLVDENQVERKLNLSFDSFRSREDVVDGCPNLPSKKKNKAS